VQTFLDWVNVSKEKMKKQQNLKYEIILNGVGSHSSLASIAQNILKTYRPKMIIRIV